MANQRFDTFISYRRNGGDAAALLMKAKLEQRGRRVFVDVANLSSGNFDESLFRSIEAAPNFLVVLSPGSLDRSTDGTDWMREEIVHALATTSLNVVPVFMPGFAFPEHLPPEIQALRKCHGIEYHHTHCDSAIAGISRLLTPVTKPRTLGKLISAAVVQLAVISAIAFRSKIQHHPPPEPPSGHTVQPSKGPTNNSNAQPELNVPVKRLTGLLEISHDSVLENATWYLDRKALIKMTGSTMNVSYFRVPFGIHSLKIVTSESTCEGPIEITSPEQKESKQCPE